VLTGMMYLDGGEAVVGVGDMKRRRVLSADDLHREFLSGLGPTWLVGVDEDPDRPCLARGALNAERLEVTLFRDFEPTSAT